MGDRPAGRADRPGRAAVEGAGHPERKHGPPRLVMAVFRRQLAEIGGSVGADLLAYLEGDPPWVLWI